VPDLTIGAFFTKSLGQPAAGLALSDIDFYLTRQDRATGVDTVVWDGTQNPTAEIDNVGAYIRILTTADLDAYNYYATANYTGAIVLDILWVSGSVGLDNIPLGTALDWPYLVTKVGVPVDGAKVQISTDIAGARIIWTGYTGANGYAVDIYDNNPRLVPGTYYFWVYKVGVVFSLPDTEVVS